MSGAIAFINQLLTIAATLLGSLKASGVNTGPIGDIIARDLAAYQADVSNYQSGQAVIMGEMSEGGTPGYIIACSKTGAAAQALGLS